MGCSNALRLTRQFCLPNLKLNNSNKAPLTKLIYLGKNLKITFSQLILKFLFGNQFYQNFSKFPLTGLKYREFLYITNILFQNSNYFSPIKSTVTVIQSLVLMVA